MRRISALSEAAATVPFGSATMITRFGVTCAERDHAAAPDARKPFDAPLEILGVILAAVDHDEILQPSADEQLTVRQVAEISGVQPSVPNGARGRFGVLIVAQHDGRAGQRDLPDFALVRGRIIVAHDAERVAGQADGRS